jgi:hypothetical protein
MYDTLDDYELQYANSYLARMRATYFVSPIFFFHPHQGLFSATTRRESTNPRKRGNSRNADHHHLLSETHTIRFFLAYQQLRFFPTSSKKKCP